MEKLIAYDSIKDDRGNVRLEVGLFERYLLEEIPPKIKSNIPFSVLSRLLFKSPEWKLRLIVLMLRIDERSGYFFYPTTKEFQRERAKYTSEEFLALLEKHQFGDGISEGVYSPRINPIGFYVISNLYFKAKFFYPESFKQVEYITREEFNLRLVERDFFVLASTYTKKLNSFLKSKETDFCVYIGLQDGFPKLILIC